MERDEFGHEFVALAQNVLQSERRRARDCESSAAELERLSADGKVDVEVVADAALDFLQTVERAQSRFGRSLNEGVMRLVDRLVPGGVRALLEAAHEGEEDGWKTVGLGMTNGQIVRVLSNEDGDMREEPLDGYEADNILSDPDPDTTPVGDPEIPGIDLHGTAPDPQARKEGE